MDARPDRGCLMPVKVGMEVDAQGLIRALGKLDDYGRRYVDEGVRSMANDVARQSAARVQGRSQTVARSIKVWGEDGYYLIGVEKHGEDDRLGNWFQYGTGQKREAARRVSDKPGMKGQRFLRRPPRAVQQAMILAAIVRAARRAGFDLKGSI